MSEGDLVGLCQRVGIWRVLAGPVRTLRIVINGD